MIPLSAAQIVILSTLLVTLLLSFVAGKDVNRRANDRKARQKPVMQEARTSGSVSATVNFARPTNVEESAGSQVSEEFTDAIKRRDLVRVS